MKRRDLVGVLGLAVASWPRIGIAQQPKAPVIGVLVIASPGSERFYVCFASRRANSATSTGKPFDSSSDAIRGK